MKPEGTYRLRGRWPKAAAMTVAGLVCAVLVFEVTAWAYYKISAPPLNRWESYRTNPPPFRNAPFYNDRFLADIMTPNQGPIVPKGTNLYIWPDYELEYFSVRNGQRTTTGQPGVFDRRVLMFGSSTLFGPAAPDAFTIASYLQALLNSRNHKVRVENFGVPSARAFQQLEMLKLVGMEPGDIVVFFDGSADILHGVYYKVPPNQPKARRGNILSQFDNFILKSLARYKDDFFALKFIHDLVQRKTPEHLRDGAGVKKVTRQTAEHYKDVIQKADEFTALSKGKFFHFFQPNLFTRDSFSEFEKDVLGNYKLVPNGIDVAFGHANGVFRQKVTEMAAHGIRSFDLSDVFNPKPEDQEYYFDMVHISHLGNKRIAEVIYELIAGELRIPLAAAPRKKKFGIPDYVLKQRK